MSNYRKTMGQAIREMYPINEDNIDLMRKAAGGAAQTVKMKDGKLKMDMFTASAIMKVFDKVNPASQKKMADMINKGTKGGMMKLQDFAMKQVKSENDPAIEEEVDLDEATYTYTAQTFNANTVKGTGSTEEAAIKDAKNKAKALGSSLKRRISMTKEEVEEEVELDEFTVSDVEIAMKKKYGKVDKEAIEKLKKVQHMGNVDRNALVKVGHGKLHVESVELDEGQERGPKQLTNPNKEVMVVKKNKVVVIDKKDQDKYLKQGWSLAEEADLDEAKQVLAHGGKGQYKAVRDGDITKVMYKGKVVGTADFDRGADSFFASIKGEKGQKSFDDAQAMVDYFAKNKITEEVELDEGEMNNRTMQANKPRLERKGQELEAYANKSGGIDKKDMMKVAAMLKRGDKSGALKYAKTLDTDPKEYILNLLGEEVELDEGKMSQLHQYIKDKKSPEEIAKLMKVDVKTIKALMSSHHPEDVEEASGTTRPMSMKIGQSVKKGQVPKGMYGRAAKDARRSMSKDKDFSRKDSADDDTGATDDDVKGASKNIIMQMRKAQSLSGNFAVEFGDGKKVKIPAKMAVAVQQKYNAMKKPVDKEKFQARIGKSYKDMLSALKEELQPKKESILERMNRKLKENKHG